MIRTLVYNFRHCDICTVKLILKRKDYTTRKALLSVSNKIDSMTGRHPNAYLAYQRLENMLFIVKKNVWTNGGNKVFIDFTAMKIASNTFFSSFDQFFASFELGRYD